MKRIWLSLVGCLLAGGIGLHAQEEKRADTVVLRPHPLPVLLSPFDAPLLEQPFSLELPDPGETKEQRAARINKETYRRVMTSVENNLSWHKPRKLSQAELALLSIGALFLKGPYSFQQGTRPVMSASNPFMFNKEPGGAPIIHPYSPDAFPQCIRLEYDFKSGTYKEVMVRWEEVQKSMARRYGPPIYDPIPPMKNHSTDYLVP